ncbi:hypothetical protein FPOA_06713 [Fusarium poae]|uniref:Cyanovirin-N domain-containing protein n=1 Tax=Fusarium poae TaxID=36050 RepID=A0A1B8AIV9_FUSPO|nr:hypothetical protein FPOA_06713 [Fusarium poae]
MLFTTFTNAALTTLTLLAAPALGSPIEVEVPGLESHLQSRASDIRVKFWDSTSCKTSRSNKWYNRGHCIKSLDKKDVAVSMQEKKSGCYMIKFKKQNCQGTSVRKNNLHDCFDIASGWESLKFVC